MLLVLLLAALLSCVPASLSSSLSFSPAASDTPTMADPSSPELMAETCSVCACMSVENVLYVSCEKLTVYRPTQLIPPVSQLYHLNFQYNILNILYPNSFPNFTHAVSLQLGNNNLQNIEGGAFSGMSSLKQLHLNNNELKVLRADTFIGVENLEYLQADYNLIKYIEKGAFNKLHKLKVLILNDNLIQALPDNIFRFASLTHLDIRGNRIQKLPYIGVLEHIGRIVELQLDDNPWNCTCDLAPLKAWLENMPYNIFIGEAVCETPNDLYGRLLKETNKQELCPMGTASDFDVRMPPLPGDNGPSKMSPTTIAPMATKSPKTTDSSKIYGNGIVAGLPPFGRNSQIVSFQTRTPPIMCPQPCSCKAHPSDFGISISCQERNIKTLADLVPKPPNAKKLHLSGNYIRDISPVDFQGLEGLDLLHLGSNQIVTVPNRVFANLTNLRRLYLNGNQLEELHPEMFLGLTNLQYLYLEYNAIKEILAGTFDSMPNLQLLYLNNNVLRSLPAYVFAGVPLARLNLKNNHFMTMPVSGVLDQLQTLTQIDLEGNPWDCSCDLVALKLWLEKLNDGVAAKEVKCASPVQFANTELRQLKSEIICPKLIHRRPFILTSATPVLTSLSPAGVGKTANGGPVPLSIMILSILVVLILTVFVAFCLLVFVLRRNKKPAGRQEGLGNQECGSMSLQLRRHNHKSGKKCAIPGDDLGGETFIPQTIEHIGKSHTCGIGRNSDLDAGFKFADSQRQKIILRNCEKDKDALSTLERNKRLSTIDELEEFLPNREPSMFIQNFLDRKGDFSSIGMGGYEIRYPDSRSLDRKMKKTSLIGGNHSKIVVEQRKSEYYELKAKLQGTPDYLQVLEEQTALSKM
ncbi:hypothetical protein WMY93_009273 [Mugilogobius chulae]|uniref:LRRCT domain-containing protein n=1 Tax=Mugilogobius chulae TaxID=88201 RepID=A0AAW0PCE0_9GOBI